MEYSCKERIEQYIRTFKPEYIFNREDVTIYFDGEDCFIKQWNLSDIPEPSMDFLMNIDMKQFETKVAKDSFQDLIKRLEVLERKILGN